jgi:uncharacterized protein (TIGR02421 family)
MSKEKQRIVEISNQLYAASSSVHILRNIAWTDEVRVDFFKHKAEKLPTVSYAPYDPNPVLQQIKTIRKLIGNSDVIDVWASRIADKIESSALLLSSRGTPAFLKHSSDLYGNPSDTLQNGTRTVIDLASHFDQMFDCVKDLDLGAPPESCVLAQTMADQMEIAVKSMFGDLAPEVVLDPNLASNALAGRRRIAFKPTACFTDKDIDQLIHHEAFVHVATSLNGYLQTHLKILRAAHAGTTITQEGLAVFAEFITGNIDLDRLRRLSDRAIAIKMAIDGADFLEVYRFYLGKSDNREQSFQNTKRVFRGGLITGKAPFTKDIVYLQGLINVYSFLRVALSKGRFEYLNLLFVGKLDISDLPALKQLSEMGLIEKAKFLPPWMQDKRYLLSYLSYSSFMSTIDLAKSKSYYEHMLD